MKPFNGINPGPNLHIMYIKNVEASTYYKDCPICKTVVCKRDQNHGDREFKQHVDLHK
jgi:hypothetical protein